MGIEAEELACEGGSLWAACSVDQATYRLPRRLAPLREEEEL